MEFDINQRVGEGGREAGLFPKIWVRDDDGEIKWPVVQLQAQFGDVVLFVSLQTMSICQTASMFLIHSFSSRCISRMT